MPPPLIGRSQQPVRIAGIDGDIGNAGVLADGENVLPRFSAVGGLENPAIAARRPQRTLRRHVDHVRIPRVDHDSGDVLRILQPQIPPASAAVIGPIDSVAPVDAALAVVLARPDPHGGRIFRIECHRSDGIRALIIKHGRPGNAIVNGFPHTAGRDADKILRGIFGIDGKTGHAPGSRRRTDGSQPQTGKRVARFTAASATPTLGRTRQAQEQEQAQDSHKR